MDYMAAHGLRRARPAELVPGTLRVVTARMDYLPRTTPTGWQAIEWDRLAPARAGDGLALCARTRLPQGAARPPAGAGRCARRQVGPFGHRVFTDSAPVLEVELAARSGIGWRGKHTLVLDRAAGSMFFLGEIYVDLALPLTEPATAHCGSCSACIDICPTQAIVGPERLDARRCISYLTIGTRARSRSSFAPRSATASTAATIVSSSARGTSTRRSARCRTSTSGRRSAMRPCCKCGNGARATSCARPRAVRSVASDMSAGSAMARSRSATHCGPVSIRPSSRRSSAVATPPRRSSASTSTGRSRRRSTLAGGVGEGRGFDEGGGRSAANAPSSISLRRRHHGDERLSSGNTASQTGMLIIPSSVDKVTMPATKAPSPPIRAAST